MTRCLENVVSLNINNEYYIINGRGKNMGSQTSNKAIVLWLVAANVVVILVVWNTRTLTMTGTPFEPYDSKVVRDTTSGKPPQLYTSEVVRNTESGAPPQLYTSEVVRITTLEASSEPYSSEVITNTSIATTPGSLSQFSSGKERFCNCSVKVKASDETTKEQLNLLLPWLNLTAKEDLAKHQPNFPAEFFYTAGTNGLCSLLPTLFSIEWRNLHWQEQILSDTVKLLLYSASYDPNPAEAGVDRAIRVLGVSRAHQPLPAWCHVWYASHQPPTITKITSVVHLDYQSKKQTLAIPYLFTCGLPPDASPLLPAAVSIVPSPCTTATNLLQVIGAQKPEPINTKEPRIPPYWVPAVCSTALYYYQEDFSMRLVEWLELLKAEGFGRVFLYNSGVHPNVLKVLQYYQNQGFVEFMDYNYPPPYTNEPSLKRLWTLVERHKMWGQENIYFNDCLLRHRHQYRYIIHLDPDEMPILPNHQNFTHFLNHLISKSGEWRSGFRLKWRMFNTDLAPMEDAPSYLWMLRYPLRPTADLASTNGRAKTLYDTTTYRPVYSHDILAKHFCKGRGNCETRNSKMVPVSEGYLGHFTWTCGDQCKKAKSTTKDLWLQKFRTKVSVVVERVLKQLQIL